MNILLQVLGFISLSYESLNSSKVSDDVRLMSIVEANKKRNAKERATAINIKILSKLFVEEDIYKRIEVLERGHKDYATYTKKEIHTFVCWNPVLKTQIKNHMTNKSNCNCYKDVFKVISLYIIPELRSVMCLYFDNVTKEKDEFYCIEIINALNLIEYLDDHSKKKFDYEVVEIIMIIMLVHHLKASNYTDDITKNKITEGISKIKKLDQELRKMILPKSQTFAVFNNIVEGMQISDILTLRVIIHGMDRYFKFSNILNCHPAVRHLPTKYVNITVRGGCIIAVQLSHYFNMEEMYKTLEILKYDYKAGHYSDYECNTLFCLYFLEFISNNATYLYFFQNLLYKALYPSFGRQRDLKLSQFLTSIVPVCFVNNIYRRRYSCRTCPFYRWYHSILRIVDCRKRLLINTTYTASVYFHDLNAEDKLKCIKEVLDCYSAFITTQCNHVIEVEISPLKIGVLGDISKTISQHLENIDPVVFDKDSYRYVQICLYLRELTERIVISSMPDSVFFSDYPEILEFYEEYYTIGLQIDCIFNICFLVGKNSNGTKFKLYPGKSSDVSENYFYTAAHMFTIYLSNIDISRFDSRINNILDLIMRCLIEIKQRNNENTIFVHNAILKYFNSIIGQNFDLTILKKIFPAD